MTTVINQITSQDGQEIQMTVRDNERGPAGKDGVIQYEAGSGIKIEDNVISVFGQAGGSVDWGTIGGNIESQTDLQEALAEVSAASSAEIDSKLEDYTPSSNLANVATSGSYNDLSNKPTIPTIHITSVDPGEGQALAANNFIAVYEA